MPFQGSQGLSKNGPAQPSLVFTTAFAAVNTPMVRRMESSTRAFGLICGVDKENMIITWSLSSLLGWDWSYTDSLSDHGIEGLPVSSDSLLGKLTFWVVVHSLSGGNALFTVNQSRIYNIVPSLDYELFAHADEAIAMVRKIH
ncbi:hypothetical protein SERLA73DRAFT_73697 [Serpula lacrymans var. lacrymans S7.3]|uniref:Uncharacterized protein n=1 Tax=Serpula lacrymans var. lacrymans (strain S7.3) TaxID=936435 RepID=F8PZ30_SERL3|nr:hypothetical protein SERLA73DRAFT_73697 [Serpula lacrymans var. lacrymans S7.3]